MLLHFSIHHTISSGNNNNNNNNSDDNNNINNEKCEQKEIVCTEGRSYLET